MRGGYSTNNEDIFRGAQMLLSVLPMDTPDDNGVSALVGCLESKKISIVEAAALVIARLSEDNPTNQGVISDAGAIEALVDNLQKDCSCTLINVLKALTCLASRRRCASPQPERGFYRYSRSKNKY